MIGIGCERLPVNAGHFDAIRTPEELRNGRITATAPDEDPSCRDPGRFAGTNLRHSVPVDVQMRDDDPVLRVGTDGDCEGVDRSPRISDDYRILTRAHVGAVPRRRLGTKGLPGISSGSTPDGRSFTSSPATHVDA